MHTPQAFHRAFFSYIAAIVAFRSSIDVSPLFVRFCFISIYNAPIVAHSTFFARFLVLITQLYTKPFAPILIRFIKPCFRGN